MTTSTGALVSVAGITSWGSATESHQLAANAFADWANAIRILY